MTGRRALSGLAVGFVLTACADWDRTTRRPWHEELPPLRVAVSPSGEAQIVLDTVRATLAPAVQFQALVQADPNHVTPVTAPAGGVLVRVAARGPARQRDTLAVIDQGSNDVARLLVIRAPHAGAWSPRREEGQLLWQGETVGLLERHEYWMAVGAISDIEAGVVHAGDPATVTFDGVAQAPRPARVEWVEGPGRQHPYSAEVAVDFRIGARSLGGVRPATVTVYPSGPEDSLGAVPASAVVRLPLGAAVFVPADSNFYEVRWISVGATIDHTVLVRDRIASGTLVVAHGLAALVAAARDSLEKRSARR